MTTAGLEVMRVPSGEAEFSLRIQPGTDFSLFNDAACQGNVDALRSLVQTKGIETFRPTLKEAYRWGIEWVEVVRYLVELEPVLLQDPYGLRQALVCGYNETVDFILQHDLSDATKEHVLMAMVTSGFIDGIKRMLSVGTRVTPAMIEQARTYTVIDVESVLIKEPA